MVIVAKVRGAMRLAAVDARAEHLGIAPGLTLADARARVPDLVAFPHDADADRRWLDRMARQCHAYSPMVAVQPPDGIVIDIAGVEHLFGGERALAATIETRFEAAGMTVRMACGTTIESASALARHAASPIFLSPDAERAAIRALPVTALGLPPDATLALRRAGLTSIGDIAARASASIAARFGREAVTACARLLGHEAAPVELLVADAPLRFERRFAEPVGSSAAIGQAMAALLGDAFAVLAQRGLGGRCFRLLLCRSDGATHRLDIETGRPTRDAALVLRLFDERIDTLADPLDPGFGYDSMALAIPAADPLGAVQSGFDGSEQAAGALTELIDRLSTRLGAGSLRRLIPQDSHLPERAQIAAPAIDCPGPVRWPAPTPGEPPMRPLFLFDPPRAVEVIAEVPDGPPHRFRWQQRLHDVRLFEGPERIAPEWWRHQNGEMAGKGALTRDYYRIEDRSGRRFWMFRHGLYGAEKTQTLRWYLHGLFG